jgi:UDP-N-acetylmuramoyl-tripeptide--D-alanyl-D-alanine ligase
VIELTGDQIAELTGADVASRGTEQHPARAVTDSRHVRPGDLFVGLPGEHHDGGRFARDALLAGAWGAIVSESRVADLDTGSGWVFGVGDPLAALQDLARGWHRRLGCQVVGITGSTGKTSVKDICRSLLGSHAYASPENYNTEIGLPLAILMAPAGTGVMVLEMAMRGQGQIAELCRIAEPNVAVVTNVGPVHLELLGTLEAIAEAKAEIIASLAESGTAIVPADAGPLGPHLDTHDPKRLTFGEGGDVHVAEATVDGTRTKARIRTPEGEEDFEFPFPEAHNLTNALAAVAAGLALGVPLAEMSDRAPQITFSRLRGELIELDDGAMLINDCYNANPMSMRAALDHLSSREGRKIAVLGEMAELGEDAEAFHREIGEHARDAEVDVVLGVGPAAEAYGPDEQVDDPKAAALRLAELIQPGDVVLVKGSRSVGLETIAEDLAGKRP